MTIIVIIKVDVTIDINIILSCYNGDGHKLEGGLGTMQVTIKVKSFKWALNQELLLGFTTLLFVILQFA